jgi:hypothetical protein
LGEGIPVIVAIILQRKIVIMDNAAVAAQVVHIIEVS